MTETPLDVLHDVSAQYVTTDGQGEAEVSASPQVAWHADV